MQHTKTLFLLDIMPLLYRAHFATLGKRFGTTTGIDTRTTLVLGGTGRLSCTDPNLQNMPILTEAGREVRKAIVPAQSGCSIVSIDYNQVELRLLAALSKDA